MRTLVALIGGFVVGIAIAAGIHNAAIDLVPLQRPVSQAPGVEWSKYRSDLRLRDDVVVIVSVVVLVGAMGAAAWLRSA